MKKWQDEFESSLNKPELQWQDKLRGQIPDIETDPEDPNACNNRGIVSARKGMYEAAIAHFTRAFQRNPVFAEAYYNRGLVDLAIGQLGQAVSDFTKAVEIKPDFISIGADSKGSSLSEPLEEKIASLINAIESAGIKIKVKKNLYRIRKEVKRNERKESKRKGKEAGDKN